MGMNIPGFTAIFTRHIDKGKEAFDWSVRAALIGMGSGIAGALGGIIAHKFGFNVLFTGIGVLIFFVRNLLQTSSPFKEGSKKSSIIKSIVSWLAS